MEKMMYGRQTIKDIKRTFCVAAVAFCMALLTVCGSQAQTVQGPIAERYNQLGGAAGPLGRLLSNEMPAADGRGRYNLFQNGMIALSAPTGPKSTQVVYRKGSQVVFLWGPTDPFGYDKFIVRWTINNGSAAQIDVNGQGMSGDNFTSTSSRSDGKFTLNLSTKDSVSFIVEGADHGTFSSSARQGWTTPVWVGTPPASAPPPQVHPVISVTSTGADANSVFTVIGTGFTPFSIVNVRVTDDALKTIYYSQKATSTGQLRLQQAIYCIGGYYIHFSATDGRSNPQDVTGNLWSNTVTLLCSGSGSTSAAALHLNSDKGNKSGQKIGALSLANSRKSLSGAARILNPDGTKTK